MLCCQCPSVPFTLAQDGGITLPRCRSDVTILCHCCCRTGLTARPSPCQSCSGPPLSHNFRHWLVFHHEGKLTFHVRSGVATAVNPPYAALSHFVVFIVFLLARVALHTVHMWFDETGTICVLICPWKSSFCSLFLLQVFLLCSQKQLICLM